ncbi:Iron-sulfur cluster-binding protein [uncultured Candidatus Thioglobus sp.]|nr:Iron-sulfur cluster-binding protein [uncultured Candidatus Thioglobus sp.]SMM98903.1 Iron-sulfur cluster-binding protein [uncultured Candidatus Thioglobus sp.]
MNNLQAKQKAITALADIYINPTSVISYKSAGFVLIVSESIEEALKITEQLGDKFTPHYLLQNKTGVDKNNTTYGNLITVNGYLGSFEITAMVNNKIENLMVNKEGKYFDIVIDLVSTINIAPVPPFGYYGLNKNGENVEIFAEINQLIGILDKPKFFNLDATLCVHNRNKTELCQRCIDSCPADAISSNGDSVDVNPNLCHGCGGCSSACPTGAISYAYPTEEDTSKKLYVLVGSYLKNSGKQVKLLFHTADNEALLPELESNTLPLAQEEIGSLGLETFLYAFCLGVENIIVHCTDEPAQTIQVLHKQINLTHKLLHSLGYQSQNAFVQLITDISQALDSDITPLSDTIGLIELSNKRNRIFAMIDFLYTNKQTQTPLSHCDFSVSDDAYFGEVIINKELCTLCMACTSVCPPKALTSGNIDKPIVNFQESLCVQCGLCVKSCPEEAMQLNSRLIFDNQQRTSQKILNADQPFRCVDCGKVFGSNQVIQKMMEKLKNHSMFADGKINNLAKCEDCRVKALF